MCKTLFQSDFVGDFWGGIYFSWRSQRIIGDKLFVRILWKNSMRAVTVSVENFWGKFYFSWIFGKWSTYLKTFVAAPALHTATFCRQFMETWAKLTSLRRPPKNLTYFFFWQIVLVFFKLLSSKGIILRCLHWSSLFCGAATCGVTLIKWTWKLSEEAQAELIKKSTKVYFTKVRFPNCTYRSVPDLRFFLK